MFDFLKKPVFLIILAAALIIGGIWAYISNRNEEKVAQQAAEEAQKAKEVVISNLTNINTTTIDTAAEDQLAVADGKAAEVDKKNVLIAVEVRLPQSLDSSSGDTTYIYSSTSDKTNNWIITLSNASNNFLRARVPKEDYIGDLKAVNRSYWKTNYVAALQIAEKNGGLNFRSANEISEIKLLLKNSDPKNWLYWFVSYSGKNNVKQYQIDVSTGGIVTQ